MYNFVQVWIGYAIRDSLFFSSESEYPRRFETEIEVCEEHLRYASRHLDIYLFCLTRYIALNVEQETRKDL